MNTKGNIGITTIVLVALGILVMIIIATQLSNSNQQFREELNECEKNAGVCISTCSSRGQALPYTCGEELKTCCLRAGEQGIDINIDI